MSEFFPRSVSAFGEPSLRQALPPRASSSFVLSPWEHNYLLRPWFSPSSKLIGFTVSGPTSLLFPYVFRLLCHPEGQQIHHVLPLSTVAAAVGLLMVITSGNCTHSSNLSCNTVARSVVYSCPQGLFLTRQRVVPLSSLSIPHSHIWRSSTLRRSLRLNAVFLSPSSIPCSGHTLTAFSQERSLLNRVQPRPEFVRSDVLVVFQDAADGQRKTMSRRGIGKVPLSSCFVLSVCSVPQLVPIVLVSLIGLFSLA